MERLAAEYDRRLLPTIVREVLNQEQVENLTFRLDVSEAINLAICASLSKRGSAAAQAYKRYRRDLDRQRKKLLGIKGRMFWDQLPRGRSKRF